MKKSHQLQLKIPGIQKHCRCISEGKVWVKRDLWGHYIYLVLLLLYFASHSSCCVLTCMFLQLPMTSSFMHPAAYRSYALLIKLQRIHGIYHSLEWQWLMKNGTASLSNWIVIHKCKNWFTFPPRMYNVSTGPRAQRKYNLTCCMPPWCCEFTNHTNCTDGALKTLFIVSQNGIVVFRCFIYFQFHS